MGRKSKIATWTEYAAARSAFGVLGALPRSAAISTSMAIMNVLPVLLPALRRTGMTNLEIAYPEKTVAERTAILNATFENLGRVLGELSQFHKYEPPDLKRLIDFELDDVSSALYERNKTEKRGVLITTGHLGNWELLVFGFAALYEPISYLARRLDNIMIGDMLTAIRTRFANNPINKINSAMGAVKRLRNGAILGVLADVNSHPREGVFVPFFGVPACTHRGPAMLAIRSGSLIFPTFCVWEAESRRYKFVHGALIEPSDTGDLESDVLRTTAAYTAEIEKIIRLYPGQWMWIHKRWKTVPPGEKSRYDR